MKIYLIEFNEHTYDQFDAFIVASKDKQSAMKFLETKYPKDNIYETVNWESGYTIVEIKAKDFKGDYEILSSFNAG